MEIKEIISIVAIILIFVGYFPYVRDTIKGKTRPHIFSYFLWSIVTYIVFALQIKNGGGTGAWITFILGLVITFIFLLSLKNGKRDIKNIDYFFLFLTLVSIGIWLIADQPLISAILLSSIDMMAFAPTIRKSWIDPWSETLSLYVITALRHGLAILALSQINAITAMFPAVWVIANTLFATMLITRRKKISLQNTGSI